MQQGLLLLVLQQVKEKRAIVLFVFNRLVFERCRVSLSIERRFLSLHHSHLILLLAVPRRNLVR